MDNVVNELISFRVRGQHFIMYICDDLNRESYSDLMEESYIYKDKDIIDIIRKFGITGDIEIEFVGRKLVDITKEVIKVVIINLSYNFDAIMQIITTYGNKIDCEEYNDNIPVYAIFDKFISLTNHSIKRYMNFNETYIKVYDYHTMQLEENKSYKYYANDLENITCKLSNYDMCDKYYSNLKETMDNTFIFIKNSRWFSDIEIYNALSRLHTLEQEFMRAWSGCTPSCRFVVCIPPEEKEKCVIKNERQIYILKLLYTIFQSYSLSTLLFNKYCRLNNISMSFVGSYPTFLPVNGCEYSGVSLRMLIAFINSTNHDVKRGIRERRK